MITGGNNGKFAFTEIFNTEDGSVTIGSTMNYRRSQHGIGVLTIKGEDILVAFGGGYDMIVSGRNYLDSVEVYNAQKGIWIRTNMKLKEPKMAFGFLNIKLADIKSGPAFHSKLTWESISDRPE